MSLAIEKARLQDHQKAHHEPSLPCHYCGAPESREVSIKLRGEMWTRLCPDCEAWKKAERVAEEAASLVSYLRKIGRPTYPSNAASIAKSMRLDLDEIMEYLEGL